MEKYILNKKVNIFIVSGKKTHTCILHNLIRITLWSYKTNGTTGVFQMTNHIQRVDLVCMGKNVNPNKGTCSLK